MGDEHDDLLAKTVSLEQQLRAVHRHSDLNLSIARSEGYKDGYAAGIKKRITDEERRIMLRRVARTERA